MGFSFKDNLRIRQRLAATPQLHDARIARLRERARSEVGAEKNGIRIDIGSFRFGLAERETPIHEAPHRRIEFAQDHGVAAVGRERNQTARKIG